VPIETKDKSGKPDPKGNAQRKKKEERNVEIKNLAKTDNRQPTTCLPTGRTKTNYLLTIYFYNEIDYN
jgi:hypothetical protein